MGKETQLIRLIENWIRLDGRAMVWRQNTGRAQFYDPKTKRIRYVAFGRKGQADLTGLLKDGRRLELEVKTQNIPITQAQKAFGEDIRAFGGIYAVVRSLEDVQQVIQDELPA